MPKFTSFEEARLVCRVLSNVLNHPVSLSADGDAWLVHCEVDFYVALFIWVDMRRWEKVSWDTEAMTVWGRWRKENAGTDVYRSVSSAAFKLQQSPLMARSKEYISPAQVNEWSADEFEEDSNNNTSSQQEQTGYWNGYDWIYTKEDGDGEDRYLL